MSSLFYILFLQNSFLSSIQAEKENANGVLCRFSLHTFFKAKKRKVFFALRDLTRAIASLRRRLAPARTAR